MCRKKLRLTSLTPSPETTCISLYGNCDNTLPLTLPLSSYSALNTEFIWWFGLLPWSWQETAIYQDGIANWFYWDFMLSFASKICLFYWPCISLCSLPRMTKWLVNDLYICELSINFSLSLLARALSIDSNLSSECCFNRLILFLIRIQGLLLPVWSKRGWQNWV